MFRTVPLSIIRNLGLYTQQLVYVIQVSRELRLLPRDFSLELILCQKHHIHMGPFRNISGVMSFFKVQ